MDRVMPLIVILPLSALAFWAWMAWDMTNNDNMPYSSKQIWILAFLFMSVFAAVLYYITQYRKRH